MPNHVVIWCVLQTLLFSVSASAVDEEVQRRHVSRSSICETVQQSIFSIVYFAHLRNHRHDQHHMNLFLGLLYAICEEHLLYFAKFLRLQFGYNGIYIDYADVNLFVLCFFADTSKHDCVIF
jgi:hypothetical protein